MVPCSSLVLLGRGCSQSSCVKSRSWVFGRNPVVPGAELTKGAFPWKSAGWFHNFLGMPRSSRHFTEAEGEKNLTSIISWSFNKLWRNLLKIKNFVKLPPMLNWCLLLVVWTAETDHSLNLAQLWAVLATCLDGLWNCGSFIWTSLLWFLKSASSTLYPDSCLLFKYATVPVLVLVVHHCHSSDLYWLVKTLLGDSLYAILIPVYTHHI